MVLLGVHFDVHIGLDCTVVRGIIYRIVVPHVWVLHFSRF